MLFRFRINTQQLHTNKTIMNYKLLFLSVIIALLSACSEPADPPEAVGPTPSERQMHWQQLEYYGFIHFNMNTFTDMEWGTGGEKPDQFNPTELDTDQWAKVAKESGMKGIILTAKHHDGFCLWPTETTDHSVANSSWKNGEGDVVGALAESCEKYDLKFGVYLSPWDRNNEHYGTEKYVDIFHEQLRELLTNYGDIFEVWFDGANGGSGYYGGANETRKINNKTYYEWDKTFEIVRELQPNAVIFGDWGPDVRWVGNESGWANETNWSIMRRDEIFPGWDRPEELRSGHEDGTHWLPAEVDVSIRPGWYYHKREDHQVKSLPHLTKIYYESIGRNASLLLNIPVDDRGLVHEEDEQQLYALHEQIQKDFANELAEGVSSSASEERGNAYAASKANDGDFDTYWATTDSVTTASITVAFDEPTEVNRIVLQEYIPLGQRVKAFTVSAEVDGEWQIIDEQTTIGWKRILRFETVNATNIRVDITDSKGPITLANLELYRAPKFLVEPEIQRNKTGEVSFSVPDDKVELYYTVDGSEPTTSSTKYTAPFFAEQQTVKVIAHDPETGDSTQPVEQYFDLSKSNWEVVSVSTGELDDAIRMIDGDPQTHWGSARDASRPQAVVIDLGEKHLLTGFNYWPIQARYPFGIITNYSFAVSTDNKNFTTVAEGEFGNVVNNRIEQEVNFDPVEGRYIRLIGETTDGTGFRTSVAEISVKSEKE